VPDSFLSLETFRKESRVQEISIVRNGFGQDQRPEAALSALAYTMWVYISSSNLIQLWIFTDHVLLRRPQPRQLFPFRSPQPCSNASDSRPRPLAIIVAATFYLLCNVTYYAVASKGEITSSGRFVAALLFKNVWGSKAERFLNGFIALSALGNVLSVVCLFPRLSSQQCLIIQVVLPRPRESNAGRGRHSPIQLILGIQFYNVFAPTSHSPSKDWAICIITIFAVPPVNFIINMVCTITAHSLFYMVT
jgi:Amino acid permease